MRRCMWVCGYVCVGGGLGRGRPTRKKVGIAKADAGFSEAKKTAGGQGQTRMQRATRKWEAKLVATLASATRDGGWVKRTGMKSA
jgi:hypothetical protein